MKKLYLLLLVVCAGFQVYGQSPLDDRVSLNTSNQPLRDVLYDIIDQGARLSFNNNILPAGKSISITVSNERVGKVLPQLLNGTDLSFEVIGNQIVIVKRPAVVIPQIQRHNISGFIVDAETGEHIINATIYAPQHKTGTYTNEYGHYSLTLPEGETMLYVSSLGYQVDTISLRLQSNLRQELKLSPLVMAEIVVAYFNDSSLLETKFGSIELNLEQAERLPSLGGETDVLRVGYTLPGIQTGADGFGGISVRGGDIDQNLFLLDGVPIYNASHGLGLYSIYNSSAVRSAKILKGSFPAQYGGRISSIWDIQTKEGNMHQMQGEMEFGPGSLLLTLEGPLGKKGKGSWIISGRRSLFDLYSDEITSRLKKPEGATRKLNYVFQDVNAKINYRFSPNDRLFLSLYRGSDYFLDITRQEFFHDYDSTITVFANEKVVRWGNNLASLRWNHVVSDKIFANITAIFSNYYYNGEDLIDLEVLNNDSSIARNVLFEKYQSSTTDLGIKSDFDYTASQKHRLRFGASLIQHRFQPGIIGFDNLSILNADIRDTIGSYLKTPLISKELDVYVQDEISFDNGLSANIGVRGTALFVNGRTLKVLQPRLLFSLNEDDWITYNFSIARNAQFLHLLSPTNIGLPKDLWVSATQAAPPQTLWHFALGTQLKPRSWVSMDIEAYYKWFDNLVYFQGNKLETVNATNWQEEIATGEGWAYGAEALLKVERGKLGGWLSYTYSHSDRQFNSKDNNSVNNGRRFPIRLDRRHNFNLQCLYKLSKSWDVSLGFTFATGSAFTFPSKIYEIIQSNGEPGDTIIRTINVITDLNNFRMPNYHRLDFSFNHQFTIRNIKHQIKLGAYNAYFVKNPAYQYLRDGFNEDGSFVSQKVKVSLLPFFPTLRYIMQFN
ncbi:MAG: TonB-dependent receptor [Saprospiraceae bacterium]|nr:TonB-dependent receptor [Saprospiraceae bacterium]